MDTAFIGMYSPQADGTWKWSDGTATNYTSWAPNEPKNGNYATYFATITQAEDNEYHNEWNTGTTGLITDCICVKNAN